MPRLIIHFVRFGHYHLARLRSASESLAAMGWDVRGMQICTSDSVYAWAPIESDNDTGKDYPSRAVVDTLFPDAHYEDIQRDAMKRSIHQYLDRERPDAIAISGWGSADSRACLQWAMRNHCRTIVMSETRHADGNRVWWKEIFKSRLVKKYNAAIVGAQSHADYLVKLGLQSDQIFRGYNVIDDQYFSTAAACIRKEYRERCRVPFFLASNRFVEVKNLAAAIDAFRQYQDVAALQSNAAWDLCLLGDGPLRDELVNVAKRHKFRVITCPPWEDGGRNELQTPTVYFPGFRQIDELPEFYARASSFFHPATSEPWGLVINEAMASGLPVLVSRNGGAAEELVQNGENGWLFDPSDQQAMAAAMTRMTQLSRDELKEMGKRSGEILAARMPTSAFGQGMSQALGLPLEEHRTKE